MTSNSSKAYVNKFVPFTVNFVRVRVINSAYRGPASEILSFKTPEGSELIGGLRALCPRSKRLRLHRTRRGGLLRGGAARIVGLLLDLEGAAGAQRRPVAVQNLLREGDGDDVGTTDWTRAAHQRPETDARQTGRSWARHQIPAAHRGRHHCRRWLRVSHVRGRALVRVVHILRKTARCFYELPLRGRALIRVVHILRETARCFYELSQLFTFTFLSELVRMKVVSCANPFQLMKSLHMLRTSWIGKSK